jgi:hypothetical protein
LPCFSWDVRVRGERRDRAPHEVRRLRGEEVRLLRRGIAPVLGRDAEVVQHLLRTQEARGHGERGDPMVAGLRQVLRHSLGESDHRNLDHVVSEHAPVFVAIAVRHLDDQAGTARQQQWGGESGGDEVGPDRLGEHRERLVQR